MFTYIYQCIHKSVYVSISLYRNVLKHICVYVFLHMKQESKQRLAELVKRLRGRATQKEFAKRLGVTSGAIQAWENGEVTPGASNLVRIAKEAGYTLEELMTYLDVETHSLEADSLEPSEIDHLINKIATMPAKQLAQVGRVVSDRLVAIAESSGAR
jgi:transcriptional regulator with XRE-family HTH domain